MIKETLYYNKGAIKQEESNGSQRGYYGNHYGMGGYYGDFDSNSDMFSTAADEAKKKIEEHVDKALKFGFFIGCDCQVISDSSEIETGKLKEFSRSVYMAFSTVYRYQEEDPKFIVVEFPPGNGRNYAVYRRYRLADIILASDELALGAC